MKLRLSKRNHLTGYKNMKIKKMFFVTCTTLVFLMMCFVTAGVSYAAPKTPNKSSAKGIEKKAPSKQNDQEKFVSIDFNNVDINVFIKFISELTGTNFVVDNKVKGKVTIISPSRISANEAFNVFESVLEVHGYGTVKAGEIVKIVSLPEARTKNIKTLLEEESRGTDDKIVTQLISLKYADPTEIKRLVAPLISKSSVMLAYDQTGILIVTDIYSNIVRLMRIIKHIDVQDVGQNISVLPLQFADATKTVKVIETLFKSTTSKRRKKLSAGKDVKFVADERTNSIIVLASEVDTVRVNELVKMLDKEVPKGKEKIHVYYLENAVAEELAKVLQSLSGKKTVSRLPGKKNAPIVSEQVTITADKATNSLIMMAEKDEYKILEDIIKKLDIPRAMVYMECLIAEVNVSKSLNIGVEWTAGEEVVVNDVDGGMGVGFSGNEQTPYSKTAGLAGVGTNVSVFPTGFSMGVFGEAITIGDVIFPNLGAVIASYKSDKDVNILSTPQILTTDNEEASITVGKNMPFITKMGTSTTETSYNNYEYKNVGKTLKITPQISKDRQVRLKINLEVTDLDIQASTEVTTPTTFKRTIDTTVIVKDKNTVVIGGLIDDNSSQTEFKVPCLGDIPLLGYLFKSMGKSNDKTNLYIFLTPHVVGNPYEAKMLFNSKKDQIEKIKNGKIMLYDEDKTSSDTTISEGDTSNDAVLKNTNETE